MKTSENTSISGYDTDKKIKGRKRHIMVDTCGNLLALYVHTCFIPDDHMDPRRSAFFIAGSVSGSIREDVQC